MTDLKPIRTAADHHAALAEIERLWGSAVGTPQGDRLDILVTLVEAYEKQHVAMDPPDPIDAILYRLEQAGLTRKDLEPLIGHRGRVSEVLNRKRPLTVDMIRRLRDRLGISADVLIGRPGTPGGGAAVHDSRQ